MSYAKEQSVSHDKGKINNVQRRESYRSFTVVKAYPRRHSFVAVAKLMSMEK
jgi:hypothetical protein